MKQLVLVSLIVTIFGLCSTVAIADNITTIASGTQTLNYGDNLTYDSVPALDPGTEQCKLTFWMRSSTSGSGFSYGVHIYVNDIEVIAADSRFKTRLRNKDPNGVGNRMYNGVIYDWDQYCREATGWVMILRTNYDNASSPAWAVDPQWGYYELSVEDLVYDDQDNEIVFTNDHGSLNMVVDNITIGTYDNTIGFGNTTAEDEFPFGRSPRRTPSVGTPTITVDDTTGAIIITLGSDNYSIASAFSYPNGGYNFLGTGNSPETEEQAFDNSTSVTEVSSTNFKVTAAGDSYSLSRRVTASTNGKIHIQDNITNTSGSDLGVIVKNYLQFQGR